ncbi:MAG TPA: hypothetical protein VKF38_06875, partial [Anaerolineaceae bacterium]|nr:hypothetical protein [Anaerolineaceae bacterium]
MSEIEPCVELNGEDYLIIDQLDDLFVLESNPIQSLQSALEIILNSFNRSGGALFIQWQQGFTLPYWFQYNIPMHWQIQLDDPDSQLNKLAKNAIETRKVLAVDVLPDIAAVFPINFKDQCIGALVVWGNAISQKEYPKWLAYLKPIARTTLAFQLSESTLHSQDLLALQSITDLPTDKLELATQVSLLKRSVADLEAKRLEILNSRNTLRVFFDNIAASVYIIDQSYLMVAIN